MRNPIGVGYLELGENGIEFVKSVSGNLRIYEYPGSEKSVIGSDVAEGLEHGDDSASVVLGLESNNTLAAYNSNKMDPDQFAIFNKNLGLYYNKAYIGVERNAVGFSVVSDLIKIYPPNLTYFNVKLDEKRKIKTKKFGWITDERTRHLILSDFKKEVREESTELRDKKLIQQCMKFVNVDGKPQATEGEKDDLVFARAIAGRMRRHRLHTIGVQKIFVPGSKKVY